MWNYFILHALDEIILKCRTEQSKEYISEAVSCYRAGAYRAVIVNTWIAIVYDLIDKIRELSISGDNSAKQIISKFENYQKQIDEGNDQAIKSALEFERNILKTAKDEMQFFSQQQFLDLSRLREDRHRCAHPSFHRIEEPYKPTAELARMHLRNAIYHVLSQEPVQGKAAIDKIISLISSKYFPSEASKAVTLFQLSEFSNPKPILVKTLMDTLLFGYFTDENPLFHKDNALVAIKAILLMQREIAEDRLNLHINKIFRNVPDNQLEWAILLSIGIPEAWGGLDKASKDKVSTFIATAPDSDIVSMFRVTLKHPELVEATKERINSFDLNSLSDGILNHEYAKSAVKRAIEFYTNAKNWDSANLITEKAILPLMKYFTKDDIETILKSPEENMADLPGSHGFRMFLDSLEKQTYITHYEINELLDKYDLSRYKIEID